MYILNVVCSSASARILLPTGTKRHLDVMRTVSTSTIDDACTNFGVAMRTSGVRKSKT